jgi:DinB family protein
MIDRLDAPLLDHTDDALARPIPPEIVRARQGITAAARDLRSLPESSLTRPWSWRRDSQEEVRYGAYRAAEALEQAEIEARLAVSVVDAAERRAARIVGPATAARWHLHGLLLPLDDAMLDADPGNGEWTIRLVLGHVISSQRAYGWGTAWWRAQAFDAADPGLPAAIPESLWTTLPDEATTEADGGITDLLGRLDAILDLSAERLAGTSDAELDLGARWSGFPVTVGFRLARWSSHIREHDIQIEKTFAMLGHDPGEPARLVRHVLAAYGRAEAVVFGRRDVGPAIARIGAGVEEAAEAIRSAREAAGA